MSATRTVSWFFRAGAAFVVAYAICWAVPRRFDNIPELPATTTDREQALVFDRYFERPAPRVAIVGSSLASRLKREYFQHTDIENVSLPGGSALTGLEIIKNSTKRKPQVVVIETNVLSRGVDDVLVERYRGSTVPFATFRPVRTLAAIFEKPDPARSLNAINRNEILNTTPARIQAAGQRMVADAVVEFNKTTYDDVIRKNVATLKSFVEKARAEGIAIYLFELPTSTAISHTRYSETVRSEIAKQFRSSEVLNLGYTEDELRWDDGLHLDERSALIVADALEQALIAKLSTQVGNIHSDWHGAGDENHGDSAHNSVR
jgi:hypothetical protein